ncbi:MAG: DUF424 family protein [Methanomicrobiales archaeon]|nr:DUF424 family protein [Methanomicrobiales archaeon]
MKIHRTGSGEVIGICDTELIGSTCEDEKICITVTSYFFGTKPVPADDIKHALKEGANITMIGTQTIALAIEIGVLCEENIVLIQGVPYATIIRF